MIHPIAVDDEFTHIVAVFGLRDAPADFRMVFQLVGGLDEPIDE